MSMRPRLTDKNSKMYFITSGLGRILEQIREKSKGKITDAEYRASQGISHYRQLTRKIPRDQRPDFEHAEIDLSVAASGNLRKASCRKGCSACCHIRVQVTNSEARQIAKIVRSGDVPVDMDRLREQAAFEGNDFEYAVQPREKNRCVFLSEDGACRIYLKRPTNCRKYLVESDPKYCDGPNDNVRALVDIETEIMASGFGDLDKNFDHMPKSILRELDNLEAENASE